MFALSDSEACHAQVDESSWISAALCTASSLPGFSFFSVACISLMPSSSVAGSQTPVYKSGAILVACASRLSQHRVTEVEPRFHANFWRYQCEHQIYVGMRMVPRPPFMWAINLSVLPHYSNHTTSSFRYADGDKAAINVGFYYMANAMGRLTGGWMPVWIASQAGSWVLGTCISWYAC